MVLEGNHRSNTMKIINRIPEKGIRLEIQNQEHVIKNEGKRKRKKIKANEEG